MPESYSVKAVLSAVDSEFTATMKKASKVTDSFADKIKSGLGIGAGMAVANSAISAVSNGIRSMVGELSTATATWKTFRSNMDISGKPEKKIAKVQKQLQTFAEQTIYSSSDMASTYAQLSAVGTKSTTKLVKGFGGLASAAENPAQAMKTLSQQATQMAAKPYIQWQDFKLMVEQTPAGIAAVAKQMGKSTQQLVKDVQEGTISTQEFFDAIAAAGTSKKFTKMATTYKTVGQAMDGLQETAANKLQPAFEKLSDTGVKAISAIIDKLSAIDGNALAQKITPFNKALNKVIKGFSKGGMEGGIAAIEKHMGNLIPTAQKIGGVLAAAFAVTHINDFAGAFRGVTGLARKFKIPESVTKGLSFSGISKSALKNARGIKKSFASLGSGIDDYGAKIAMSMEAISPKLSESGTKVWSVFANTGEKISGFGKSISKGLTSKIKGATNVLSSFGSRVGTILGPIQMVASGILNLGGTVASGLTSMMGVALKAIMPAAMVGVALAGLGLIYQQFGTEIDQMLAMAQQQGPQIISNLANGISSALPGLISSGAQLVTGLLNTITANLPALISGGTQIIASLVSGVAAAAPSLISSAASMIGQFVVSVASAIPQLITTGMQLLLGLAQGVVASLPTLISSATQAVTSFISGIGQNLPQILTTAAQIIATLAGGLIAAIPQLISAIPTVISSLVDTIMSTDWISVGIQIVSAIGEGIFGGLSKIGGKIGSFFGGIGDWFAGGKKGGEETSSGAAEGIAAGSSGITTAASNVTNDVTQTFSAGAGAAKSAGSEVGSGFSTELLSGLGDSASITTQNMDDITSSMEKPAGTSKKAGKQTGTGYTNALKNGLNKAPSIASRAVSKVIARLNSGAAGARAAGTQISAGFAAGMNAYLSQIEAAASRMVAAANKAITAKAKIHSPSKVTTGYGKDYVAGFVKSIKKHTKNAAKAARSLAQTTLAAMKQAVAGGNYQSMADSLGESYEATVNKQTSKQEKTIKKKYNSITKRLEKSDKKLEKQEKKAKGNRKKNIQAQRKEIEKQKKKLEKSYNKYTKSLENQASQMISATQSQLSSLGETFQSQYDDIISKREAFYDKLTDVGDLMTSDSYGFTSFKDFDAATKRVEQYGKNLEKLKKLMPSGFMDEILGMDMAEGLNYTNALLKKSDAELIAYGKSYQKFTDTANKVSKTYYQDQLDLLNQNYINQVTAALTKLDEQIAQIGKNVASSLTQVATSVTTGKNISASVEIGEGISTGLANGLSSNKSQKKVKKATKKTTKTATKNTKKKLKSHSPSKVFYGIGADTIQGFVNAVLGMRHVVARTMDRVISIPATPHMAFAGSYDGELNEKYQYGYYMDGTIEVPVVIDGKEVARVSAPYTAVQLNKQQKRENRKKGIA